MEALKEVNNSLTEVLDKIETYMFVEDIDVPENRDTDNSSNMLFENKMVD